MTGPADIKELKDTIALKSKLDIKQYSLPSPSIKNIQFAKTEMNPSSLGTGRPLIVSLLILLAFLFGERLFQSAYSIKLATEHLTN